MFAVIVYFWNAWRQRYFSSTEAFWKIVKQVVVATVLTAVVGLALQVVIEKIFLKGSQNTDVESLFSQLPLIATALLVAGLLIIVSGLREPSRLEGQDVSTKSASWVGATQGLCLPFRGLSRSGATISTGLLLGVGKRRMEEFSFALAVVITPPVIARELWRLVKAHPEVTQAGHLVSLALPGIIGMVASFVAGLLALQLLSRWLETGRWKLFGVYCIVFAIFVFALAAFRF
jgi:undecaprenyl-diphosphatase